MDETRYEEFEGDGRTIIEGDLYWSPSAFVWVTPTIGSRAAKGYKYRRPIQPTKPAIKESLTTDRASPAPGSDTPRTDAAAYQPEYLSLSVFVEFARILERENTALRSKMTEAWKLVHAMSGQEYWDRAEQWLDENKEFKPEGFVG